MTQRLAEAAGLQRFRRFEAAAGDALGNPVVGLEDIVGVGTLIGDAGSMGVGPTLSWDGIAIGVEVAVAWSRTGASVVSPPQATSSAAATSARPNDRPTAAKRIDHVYSTESAAFTPLP